MTTLDLAATGIVLISILLSLMRGLITEVLSLSSWIIAFWVSKDYAGKVATLFAPVVGLNSSHILIGYVLTFIGIWLLTIFLRVLLTRMIDIAGLGFINRSMGAAFGFFRGCLIVAVLTLIGGFTDLPQTPIWKESVLTVPFERIVLSFSHWMPELLLAHLNYHDNDSGGPIIEQNTPKSLLDEHN